ncbi:hypothetical protein [Desulfocucumis palustris]|nr:hypothetical protein [Desulfocucumis palustris]
MAQAIANLGLNIRNRGFILKNDFLELKTAIRNELTRRSKTRPDDGYVVEPMIGAPVKLEHFNKVVLDIKAVDSTKNFLVNQGRIIRMNDIIGAITYIQTLENQITVS